VADIDTLDTQRGNYMRWHQRWLRHLLLTFTLLAGVACTGDTTPAPHDTATGRTPATPSPARLPPTAGAASPTVPTSGGSRLFALLADNHLLMMDATNGVILATRILAPPPASVTATGHLLAFGGDGQRLFVLLPGTPGLLAVLDAATAAVRATYRPDTPGIAYSGLAVGPVSGRLYLFGERDGAALVVRLDPDSGRVTATWTARPADGRTWSVFQGAVTPDERALYLSYHGPDTTGIDRFDLDEAGLRACADRTPPQVACIGAHGGFALDGDGLLTATGDSPVLLTLDEAGEIRGGVDTGLDGNHMLAFAVDAPARRVYSVGSCGYVPGFSVVDLARPGLPARSATPGVWSWRATPAPPTVLLRFGEVCGERLALGPRGLVAVGKVNTVVPDPHLQGTVLVVEGSTGEIHRAIRRLAV